MSRDFHFRCVTCSPSIWGGACDFDHQGDELLALLPHFPLFATVAKAGFEIDFDSLGVDGSSQPYAGIAAYALLHADCVVQVWDEYGEEWKGSENDYA